MTPENGMIMVFGDAGFQYTKRRAGWRRGSGQKIPWQGHFKTSKEKNIKIFWIYTPKCNGWNCGAQDKEAHQGLTEGRVYNTASNLNTDQFFKDAVLTVGKLNISPCTSGYPFNFQVSTPCEGQASGLFIFQSDFC